MAADYLSIRPLPEIDERRVSWGKMSGRHLLSLAGDGQPNTASAEDTAESSFGAALSPNSAQGR